MPYKNKQDQLANQRRHYERNKESAKKKIAEGKKKRKAVWAEYKATLCCTKCGENHPATLDFHHVVHHPDNVKVHKLLASGAYLRAKKEIEKCVVLCANCHRKHHHEENLAKKLAQTEKSSNM